jgi:hypothetical protein
MATPVKTTRKKVAPVVREIGVEKEARGRHKDATTGCTIRGLEISREAVASRLESA